MLGKLSGEFRHFGGCPGNRKPPETPETRPGNPSLVWVVLAGNLPPGSHHPLPSLCLLPINKDWTNLKISRTLAA